jgi:hypothetical protein
MTVSLLPEEDEPVYGIIGACVAATGADVGAACAPQAVSNTANTSIVLKNSLFFIVSPSF